MIERPKGFAARRAQQEAIHGAAEMDARDKRAQLKRALTKAQKQARPVSLAPVKFTDGAQ